PVTAMTHFTGARCRASINRKVELSMPTWQAGWRERPGDASARSLTRPGPPCSRQRSIRGGDQLVLGRPDETPSIASGFRGPEVLHKPRPEHQTREAGQDAEVSAAVPATDEEKEVGQSAPRRAERNTRGSPAVGDDGFAKGRRQR